MPKLCPHCGKTHATQEELDRGDDGSTTVDPEPLPRDIRAGEAPEEISEEFVPKRTRKSKK